MAPDPSRFPTTRWTVVLNADAADDAGREALSWLCERYWYPLYAYVRRRGIPPDQAQDLTQEFFGRLIERHTLIHADPERGRFRSFLLVSMKNFLADQGDWARAAKRGSGRPAVPLFAMEEGEEKYSREPAHSETPEAIYERRWALALLERVLEQIQEQYRRRGQGSHFGQLKGFLSGDGEDSRARVAAELGLSPGAIRVAIHRVRREYRALLRSEIAETVEGPEAVDEEVRRLLTVLSRAEAVADRV